VSSEGAFGRDPAQEQDLMQNWSRVNGGHYTHLQNEGDMEVAFDRAATLLRRPAPYTLVVSSEARAAPGPGRLTVTSGGAPAGGAAIELILDASGSMLQRLGAKRRIEIAKAVLTSAVSERIPAGTPVALRVFGHRQANACRSDLEAPLAPLDPARMTKTIQGIGAMNLAKTPIADSLAKVEADLRGATGRKIVVLLTDGEETCDGDPEKVIRALQDKGIDVALNIVGFAIDDAELEARFQSWAELGSGRYLSARDESGLSDALREALQMPYTAYDAGGNVVAHGLVGGDAVELAQGYYRVEVHASPLKIFERVEVAGEEAVTLTVH
jgi:Mg-chelatase subunit ChlD